VANIEVAAVADERRVVCALAGYQTITGSGNAAY